MKTSTFKQLQAKATPGPFYSSGATVTKDNGNNGYSVAACDLLNRGASDAELITRLLNWANAGGAERMQLNLEWLQAALADEPDDFDNKPLKRAIKETRKLIRILNGRGVK